MTEQILITCAGLGMGNASRVAALIEALGSKPGRKLGIHVVTWGAAYTFLREFQQVSPAGFTLIEAYPFERHWNAMWNYLKNVALIRRTIAKIQPRLIILDSDYHFPAYFGSGTPIVYIGQAQEVVERAQREVYRPKSLLETLNYLLREKLDAKIQSLFSDWVLVPSLGNEKSRGERVSKIPLIVRKEFLEPSQDSSSLPVGILLGGSGSEAPPFLKAAQKFGLKVLEPVPSRAEAIDQCDILLTQGGLSSISECIARKKFLVVFPLAEHAEQMLNAQAVEKLGLGMQSNLKDLEQLPNLLERARHLRAAASAQRPDCNGAEVAADFIFEKLALH